MIFSKHPINGCFVLQVNTVWFKKFKWYKFPGEIKIRKGDQSVSFSVYSVKSVLSLRWWWCRKFLSCNY